MKKIALASIPFFLLGCTTLDSNSDFSDAVKRIDSKQNYKVVIGESLTPDVIKVNQGQLVNSSLELNYVQPYGNNSAPDSYITMELQYFKNYNEYRTAFVQGTEEKVKLKPYAAAAETCSDICTQTQYIQFPIESDSFDQAPYKDLIFDVQASNSNSISFSIPAGYIEAIVKTAKERSASQTAIVATSTAVVTPSVEAGPATKAVDMSNYWFKEIPVDERDSTISWAVANRNGVKNSIDTTSKEVEMFSYWFEKASNDERNSIIKSLLDY